MSETVRTARGANIDMNALRRANEDTLAVTPNGGRSMNSRGDILGAGGEVVATREDFEMAYNQNIENAVREVPISSDNITADVPTPATIAPAEPVTTAEAIAEQPAKPTPTKAPSLTTENTPIEEVETLTLEDIAEQFTEKKIEPTTTEEKPKTRRRRTTTKSS